MTLCNVDPNARGYFIVKQKNKMVQVLTFCLATKIDLIAFNGSFIFSCGLSLFGIFDTVHDSVQWCPKYLSNNSLKDLIRVKFMLLKPFFEWSYFYLLNSWQIAVLVIGLHQTIVEEPRLGYAITRHQSSYFRVEILHIYVLRTTEIKYYKITNIDFSLNQSQVLIERAYFFEGIEMQIY